MNSRHLITTPTLIECHRLSKTFSEGNYHTQVLKKINFTLKAQERVAIMGSSGSGKSTFLHSLAGLESISEGSVSIMGQSITDYNHSQLNQMRNQYIGFVYQFHHLLPEFSLLENVAIPLFIRGDKKSTIIAQAFEILEKLGLKHKVHHKPREASGGERQRTALARAIITKPAFILADEPTGNLDTEAAHSIIDILCSLDQTSVVIVTHDYSIAKRMDRLFKLDHGQLVPLKTNP